MIQPRDAAFRLSAARLRLMQDRACGLYAEIGNSLTHTPDATRETLCTNGRAVLYRPEFIDQMTDTDTETALLHEYVHVALLHPVRCPPHYDQRRANAAMDYAVNLLIAGMGRTIPPTWLYDTKWTGMSWEAIYAALTNEQTPPPPAPAPQPEPQGADDDQPDDAQDQDGQPDQDADENGNQGAENGNDGASADDGEGEGEGPPAPGKAGAPGEDVRPYPGKDGQPATADELSAATAELTDRIARIAQACEMAGHGSDGSRRFLDSLTTPRDPDLYEALAALLERSPNDHSYRRLNRRLLSCGIFPGLDGEECPPLVIVIDTSGSMSDPILAACNDKVHRAVADFRPRSVTVIYCDDHINGEPETYTPDDFPPLTMHGGGGTDFRPPFAWVSEHMTEPPAALVYLTDLDGRSPDDGPDYPVIWAKIPTCYDRRPPTFGQIVPVLL